MSPNNITFILHKPQLSENIGACARAIKNFDFKKRNIEVFTIEHNFIEEKREKIFKIMTENDYKRVFENLSHWDDWYVRKDNTVLKSMIDYK